MQGAGFGDDCGTMQSANKTVTKNLVRSTAPQEQAAWTCLHHEAAAGLQPFNPDPFQALPLNIDDADI